MKSMKMLAAAAGLAFLATGANAEVANKTARIANFDLANIESVLAEMGISYQRDALGDTAVTVATIGDANGAYTVLLMPRACRSGASNCAGLMMMGLFQGANLDLNNSFTRRSMPSAAYSEGSQVTVLKRYLIGDHGYARGNLEVDIVVFYTSLQQFVQLSMGGTANKVSLDAVALPATAPQNVPPGKPMPGDDLANALNAQQKIGNVGAAPSAPQPIATAATLSSTISHAEALGLEIADVSIPEADLKRFLSK